MGGGGSDSSTACRVERYRQTASTPENVLEVARRNDRTPAFRPGSSWHPFRKLERLGFVLGAG